MRTAADQEPTQYLKNQMARIITATDFMVSSTRDWQTIKEFLFNRVNEIKLSPAQQEKLKRYDFIYKQLGSGKYTDAEVMAAAMKVFDIKQSQVYEDMSCTRELFNTVLNINKRFELSIQLQINRDMMRKAAELCDFKAYAALEKNRYTMLEMIEEVADNAGEMFTGHEIEPMFDPSLLGISGAEDIDMQAVLKDINSKRKAKIKTEMFTDIPHEEL